MMRPARAAGSARIDAAPPSATISGGTMMAAEAASTTGHDEVQVVARWLVGLRWVVFSLLAITLPVGQRYFDFEVVWPVALPALALVLGFNLFAMRRLRAGIAPSARGVAAGVAFDLVAIAAVLAASGGAANPFSALFFVHVALAASLLPARTTFALSGLAACLFASLFFLPVGACCPNPAHGAFSNHLYGMWMAFVLSAGLVAYVLSQARRTLDARQREIERLREREQENARFAALGTLAAGTAHELATPLGTIAVLAGELADRAGTGEIDPRTSALAIRDQVKRCREVITKMQAGAQAAAAAHAETSLDVAVERAVETWRAAHPEVAIVVRAQAGDALVSLGAPEIEAALCALLDNALHASMAGATDPLRGSSTGQAPIEVVARRAETGSSISVEDHGPGVAPHLAGRLGEPFLTTKEPGEGMGLGLFLVRAMVEQVGGRLEVAARAPRGTRVTLHLAEVAGS
jgi:two-component system sensor histidine kinase RegB